ncbi:MAG: serine hydrolase [Proteobacteria bacterium]|nr:serine hydrolase [Pseudomonadota bacterium]
MRKLRHCLLFLVSTAVFLPSTIYAQASDLEALVDSIAADHVGNTLAGLSVGVARGDEILLKKSYGFANLEWQVPMPMDAVHEVGSVTKQFTAVAALQLYGQEKLDLNADISEYLPDFDTQGRRIPVRRLLDHTSGIKGFTEVPEFREISTRNLPRSDLLPIIEQYPFEFEPGEALIYNNSAYFLMGLIIEAVSGSSFEDYVEENIFPLAGMSNSSYCSNSELVEQKAQGYQYTAGGLTLARYHDHTWPYSAGSLCSTLSDLVAWNQALHHGEVLSPTLYEMLITPVPLNDGTPLRYAMGLSHYTHNTGRIIEHGGGIDGFLSHSRYYPDDDVTVIVLQNTGAPPGPAAIADQIGEQLFGNRGVPAAQSFSGDLSRFTGTYRGPARGTELTATVMSDSGELKLTIRAGTNTGATQTLAYLGGNTFSQGNTRYTFELAESEDGVSMLRMDGVGSHYVLVDLDD